MDSQNTPKQKKRSSRQTETQPMPTNPNQTLSSAGSYIPHIDWVIPPSASVYDPNFFNNNNVRQYGMSHGNILPFMGQSFTGMLTHSSPMASQSTRSPTTMPNINEARDREESSPEFDEVPETQPTTPPSPPPPSEASKKGKGKANPPKDGKRKFPDRAPAKPWTPSEEVELAKAWVATSEDSVNDDFWDTVRVSFEQRTGCAPKYRTVHQVRSKCVSLGKVVLRFSNIYNNVKSQRKSGEGDSDWLAKAHFRYKEEHKTAFRHEHVWDVLKGCEKYMRTPLIGATARPKRSKTSESATPTTDASDAHGPFEDENENEDEDEEERPRPIGRNAARATASASTGGASSESVAGLLSEISTLTTTSRELIDQKRRDLDLRERDLMFRESEAEDKRKRRDYRFYISPHAHLSGGALSTTLEMKENLRQKYGWPPLD